MKDNKLKQRTQNHYITKYINREYKLLTEKEKEELYENNY